MASLARAFQLPGSVLTRPSILSSASRTCAWSRNEQPPSGTPSPATTQIAPFSSTARQLARKKGPPKKDKRISLIRYFLHHPTTVTPRPLRFSRTRALRHWTIHRAWQLHTHAIKRRRQAELELQYNAMRDACEELRVRVGDGAKLFRKAMMKTGVFDAQAVPMEYTRGLVDYVGSVDGVGKVVRVWEGGWRR